ncbi:MAG: hypothetical protein ACXWQO_10785 [Bdellovibrionota bacterium]
MTNKNDKKSGEETTATPALEEPTSADGLNFGQKVFASGTGSIATIEVEISPDAIAAAESEPAPETAAEPEPARKAASASGNAKKKTSAPLTMPEIESAPPPKLGSGKTDNWAKSAGHSAAVIPPMERKPFFSPTIILIALVAAGYFYHIRSQKEAPVVQTRAPASIVMEKPTDNIVKALSEEMQETTGSALATTNAVSVKMDKPDDELATFILKSDSDDFMVLVDGKDMPVISGKIALPLNKKFDIRFVRRGFKEIQMTTEFKKAEVKELKLKFERLQVAPEPRRLYN